MATKTKKNSKEVEIYLTDYPFETMPLAINTCKDVVKFFHNNHVPKEQLQELQKTVRAQGFVCPVLTQ